MELETLLADIVVVFLSGVISVLLVRPLGLSPIVGFLLAGLVVGPHALGLIADPETVEQLAELGVALLLFTIGLEFSLDRLRRIGRIVAIGGTLQVGLTAAAAGAVAVSLGSTVRQGVFWGFLASLSSTAIVLRALSDRGEVQSPHGRMMVGVLIFQDLCVVPMMLAIPLLAGEGAPGSLLAFVGRATVLLAAVVAAARLVVPAFLALVARQRARELFVLSILLVASGVAWATSSMGLSVALGAFLAGVVVADSGLVHQIHTEVAPIRDALASLFFVSVGMLLDPRVLVEQPAVIAAILVLLVFGKVVLAALAVLLTRFPARVALMSGLGLAQVGEFSFVLLRAGSEAGLIDERAGAAFLAASVLTLMAAPALVAWSPRLAAGAIVLRPLERLLAVRTLEPEPEPEPLQDHVIVAGMGLGGVTLVRALEAAQVAYVALELDPEVVIALRAEGHEVHYGDVSSLEVLERLGQVATASRLVLLLSDLESARRAAASCRDRWPDLHVLVRVHRHDRDLDRLSGLGAEVVSEDLESAIEVVERVLGASGVAGAVIAEVVEAARGVREPGGERPVVPTELVGALRVEAVHLGPGDHGVGRSLRGLELRSVTGATVVALVRRGEVHPSPEVQEPLQADDALFVAGTPEQLEAARRVLSG